MFFPSTSTLFGIVYPPKLAVSLSLSLIFKFSEVPYLKFGMMSIPARISRYFVTGAATSIVMPVVPTPRPKPT